MSLEQDILSREPINNARIKMYADALRSNIRELEKMGCEVSVSSQQFLNDYAEVETEHSVSVVKKEKF